MRKDYGQVYDQLYRQHWWWRAREWMLLKMIRRLPLGRQPRILDVGCGNGVFFGPLQEFGYVEGIEVDRSLILEDCPHHDRIHTQTLDVFKRQTQPFDLALALDVAEHIEDDRAFIADLFEVLKPGGHAIITVPAFMCLWDEHDRINMHYRRYRKAELAALVRPHGQLLDLRYLFASLFPLKWLIAQAGRRLDASVDQTRLPGPLVNRMMQRWLQLEYLALGRLPVPFGTSIVAVARRG